MPSSIVKKKIIPRPAPPSPGDQLDYLHPVIRKILISRGLSSSKDLDLSLAALPSPWLLSGMEDMVGHLVAAVKQQKKILIVADFDADGATSCAVAVRGLELLGVGDVSFLVPNRFEYGYGLTPEIVELAIDRRPDIIVTVDNGISSIEGVAAAKAHGMTVLITDHHLPGEQLPEADAIVNPNLDSEKFPSSALAGVGVIFYVLLALRSRLRELKWFEQALCAEPNLARLLDLVALGTVADVVPLDAINRIFVYQGLQRIRCGECCPGLSALIEVSGRQRHSMTSTDLGYAIAPRLNAAGRLDDMTLGIQCLLEKDRHLAKERAVQLDELNADRRAIEGQMKAEALALLQEMNIGEEGHLPSGICLYDKNWHQGVIGILAARIKDRLHRPVIAFAPAENGVIKGSARSISGLHIRDVLSDIAAVHPRLLEKFGGHAMAAGLSLRMPDYPVFALAFDEAVSRRLKNCDLSRCVYTDGELTEHEISLEFADLVGRYGPWGHEFPEPAFDGVFDVIQSRVVANHHLKLVLRFPFSELLFDGIYFYIENPESWLGVRQVRAVYKLDINEYRGERNVQLVMQYLEKSA
ncbi:MAG: single-stranded-DNA-specific exonuclease RecJ [Gammaproteobacteria bacterium]